MGRGTGLALGCFAAQNGHSTSVARTRRRHEGQAARLTPSFPRRALLRARPRRMDPAGSSARGVAVRRTRRRSNPPRRRRPCRRRARRARPVSDLATSAEERTRLRRTGRRRCARGASTRRTAPASSLRRARCRLGRPGRSLGRRRVRAIVLRRTAVASGGSDRGREREDRNDGAITAGLAERTRRRPHAEVPATTGARLHQWGAFGVRGAVVEGGGVTVVIGGPPYAVTGPCGTVADAVAVGTADADSVGAGAASLVSIGGPPYIATGPCS